MSWHYVADDGSVQGPTSLEEIGSLLETLEEISVWCDLYDDDWATVKNAKDIELLRNKSTQGPPELPSDWEVLVDDASGDTYYYNEGTGVTTWNLTDVITEPTEEVEPAPEQAPEPAPAPAPEPAPEDTPEETPVETPEKQAPKEQTPEKTPIASPSSSATTTITAPEDTPEDTPVETPEKQAPKEQTPEKTPISSPSSSATTTITAPEETPEETPVETPEKQAPKEQAPKEQTPEKTPISSPSSSATTTITASETTITKDEDKQTAPTPTPPPATTTNPKAPQAAASGTLIELETAQILSIRNEATKHAAQIRDSALSSGALYQRASNTFGGSTITKLACKGPWKDVYKDRTMPDGHEWQTILRTCRRNNAMFEDTEFPANGASIWQDPANKEKSAHYTQCNEAVQWRRIKDILHQTVYLKITFTKVKKQTTDKNVKPQIAGFAIVKDEDYVNAKIDETTNSGIPESGDMYFSSQEYIDVAKVGCTHGVQLERQRLSDMCTSYVAKWLNAPSTFEGSTDDGLGNAMAKVNFDIFFGSILAVCAPTHFKEFGQIIAWEEKPTSVGVLPFVRIIVPLEFAPNRIQLFERDSPTRPLVAPGDVRQVCVVDFSFSA